MKILESLDGRNYSIIKGLVEKGAELQETEDRLLVLETEAWLDQAKREPNPASLEMYHECMEDRSKYVANMIERTLKEGEIGVIFIELSCKLTLPENVRVIRMCPFEPSDYLNIWLQKLKLRKES